MKTKQTLNVKPGQFIEAEITAPDSFFKRVKGTVDTVENGRVYIQTKEVINKWSNTWKQHPTSCGMSVKIENVILV